MTLVRSKPSGYGHRDTFTSVEAEIIDSQLVFAVDGNGGGTYAPSSLIILGGQGLQVTGDFFDVTSPTAFFHDGLTIDGGDFSITSTGIFTCRPNTVVIGSGASIAAQMTVYMPTRIDGATTINGATTIFGQLTVQAHSAIFNDGIGVAGAAAVIGAGLTLAAGDMQISPGQTVNLMAGSVITNRGAIKNTDAGYISKRVYTNLDRDVGITVGAVSNVAIVSADRFFPGSLTADRIWEVGDTSDVDGMEMEVSLMRCTPGFRVQLLRSTDLTEIVTLQHGTVGTMIAAVRLVRASGRWEIFDGQAGGAAL